MLNDYTDQIKEQAEEIITLKSENKKLQDELKTLYNKVRRRNDAKLEADIFMPNKSFNHNDKDHKDKNKFDEYNSESYFEDKQEDLLKELNKLKLQLQAVSPSSDEEPERTSNHKASLSMLTAVVESNPDNDMVEKLQELLENSIKTNQRIMFADKNNQLWEIIK